MGSALAKPKHPRIEPSLDELAYSWLEKHGFDSFQMLLPNGDNVLHAASRLGDIWMCQYIISHGGANFLKHQNSNKQTPLMVAVESGHLIVCDMFHRVGNNAKGRRCDGEGDLIASVHSKYLWHFLFLTMYECVTFFIFLNV
jgi:ankyrin repeat protein